MSSDRAPAAQKGQQKREERLNTFATGKSNIRFEAHESEREDQDSDAMSDSEEKNAMGRLQEQERHIKEQGQQLAAIQQSQCSHK